MASYDYRCERDDVFELTLPIGTAPATAACPECGNEAPRIFSAPNTASPRGGAGRAGAPLEMPPPGSMGPRRAAARPQGSARPGCR